VIQVESYLYLQSQYKDEIFYTKQGYRLNAASAQSFPQKEMAHAHDLARLAVEYRDQRPEFLLVEPDSRVPSWEKPE